LTSQNFRIEENTVLTLKIPKLDCFGDETFESLGLIGNSASSTPKQVETDWNFQFKRDKMKEFIPMKRKKDGEAIDLNL